MTDVEKIVTKLSVDHHELKQLVKGNGTIDGSVIGRIKVLETTREGVLSKIDAIETKPCRTPCIFEEYQKKEKEVEDKKRSYRIGDIANVIQTLLLIATLIMVYVSVKGMVLQ